MDPVVAEEIDRLSAQLKGALFGLGQRNTVKDLEKGITSSGGIQITQQFQASGPLILPYKNLDLNADITALDPGDFTNLRITPTGANRVLRGIKGGIDGRELRILVPRSASFTLTVAHNDSTADADKRIELADASDLATVTGRARAFQLSYDGVERVWVQLGGSSVLDAAKSKAVFSNATQTGAGGTVETDLRSDTVPANTLTTDGDILVIRAFGNTSSDVSFGKRLHWYWGGVDVIDTTTQGWHSRGWQLHVIIIRTGTTSQDMHAHFNPGATGTVNEIGTFATGSADLTTAVTTKITGHSDNGGAPSDTVTFEGWFAFLIKAS